MIFLFCRHHIKQRRERKLLMEKPSKLAIAKTNIGDSMPTGYWLPCPIHWLANSGLGTSPASTEKHFLFLIYIPFFSFNPYPTFICLHHPRHSVTNFLSFILIFILQFINQYNSSRLAIDFLDFILHLFPSTFLLFV